MDLFARFIELLAREGSGSGAERRRPVEDERRLLPLADAELPDGAKILPTRLNVRVEQHFVRARNELKPPVVLLTDPRHDGAVVEPHDDLGPHGDLALQALDDAHQLGRAVAPVHEIGEGGRTIRGRENRFEDQRVADVSSCDPDVILRGRDQPPSVVRLAKQRAKARGAVETGQAQPVDRAVAPDQRHCLAVSDDGVVFNSERHRGLSGAGHGRNRPPIPDLARLCRPREAREGRVASGYSTIRPTWRLRIARHGPQVAVSFVRG